jgi:D-sedoheptulose 7-phosphate isomerase
MKKPTEKILNRLFLRRPELTECRESLCQTYQLILDSQRMNGRLLVCGNGGSAADSIHIVGELLKSFDHPRRLPEPLKAKLIAADSQLGPHLAEGLEDTIKAVSLVSEAALITAVMNDTSGEFVFAQQVLGQGSAGDVLLAITTSGNSRNVLNAAVVARALGVKVIALTGPDGGRLKALADCAILAPGANTPEIQEAHLPLYHTLCLMLESEMFACDD